MKNLIIYISVILFAFNLSGQNKRIHLAHGLSGNVDSWSDLQQRMNANCGNVTTTNGTYNSTDGFMAYANNFIQEQGTNASNDDIVIAHSFGGIAMRSVDAVNNGLFGGYITVASPHGGAQLANSVNDGLVQNYLENACTEVIADPTNVAVDALQSNFLTFFLGIIIDGLDVASTFLCDNLWEAVLTVEGWFGNPFTGVMGQTINELEIGGAGSNLPPSTLPSVDITAQVDEDRQSHWALLEDKSEINVTEGMTSVSNNFQNISDQLMGYSGLFSVRLFNPITWGFGSLSLEMTNAAIELDQAADWITRSEGGWLELIGAGDGGGQFVEYTEEVPGYDQCTMPNDCDPNTSCIGGQCIPDGIDPCDAIPPWETGEITIMVFEPTPELPHDGVVLVENQLLPGALFTPATVDNVTHFGEQENDDVRQTINEQIRPVTAPNFIFEIAGCNL